MIPQKERQGEHFIFLASLLWAFFPIVTILSYSTLTPLLSLAWSAFFAAIFFAILLTIQGQWSEVWDTSALADILLTTFFIGLLFYFFVFFALTHTSAGNVALLGLSEIFFSFLLFNIWKKEHFSFGYILGSLLMVVGALIVLWPNTTHWNVGDMLIILSTIVAPIGNFFQRRAREKVSSNTIMFIRSAIVAVVIFLFALWFDTTALSLRPVQQSLAFLLINGILLLGLSKILWIESIHRISVTKANALSGITPLLTILFAWMILKDTPTIWQLSSFVPLFVGSILLTKNNQNNN